jgi:acetylornithine deacetylase/succinyl-diaminopimelate desuccinylase-like protein
VAPVRPRRRRRQGAHRRRLAALDALRDAGVRPSVNVKFFFEGEEEAGSPHLRALLERHKALLAADAWLFADGPVHQSRRQQLVFGVRGVTGFDLTTYGPLRPLHSGHYGNWAPNPIAELGRAARRHARRRRPRARRRLLRVGPPVTAAERAALAAAPRPDSALRAEYALGRTEGAGASLAERSWCRPFNRARHPRRSPSAARRRTPSRPRPRRRSTSASSPT